MVAALNLSFRALDHPEFRKLLELARKCPSYQDLPFIPSRRIFGHLQTFAEDGRQRALHSFQANAGKISIALDGWQSPNKQSFLAVTGYVFLINLNYLLTSFSYFIDADWHLQEVLLGFEHIDDRHTGRNLANLVDKILNDCKIEFQRILTITTDNASNNKTLSQILNDCLATLESKLEHQTQITRIPCLAHVIQLSANAFLTHLSIAPKNEEIRRVWDETKGDLPAEAPNHLKGPAWTLKKVR